MSDLPVGWAWTTIGEVLGAGLFSDGDWVESKDQDPAGDVRLLQLADIGDGSFRDRSDRHLTAETAGRLGCTYLSPGDVLVARMPDPLGRACRTPRLDGPSVTAVDVCVLRPTASGVDPAWLMWAINSPQARSQIAALQSGTTRKRISRKNLATVQLALPPRAEQERIVAAIEEHLSVLDATDASLRSAVARLGHLAAKLAEAMLPDMPNVALAELAVDSRYGTSVKCDYVSAGPGVVRIPNITDGRIDIGDLKYATDPSAVSPDVLLDNGDVVFVRTNGSRDLIGRAAVAEGEAVGLGFASYLIRYRLSDAVDPHYLVAAMAAPSTRRTIEALAATTAGQYNLSISKLDSVTVPLPPVDEQRHLVERRAEHLAGVNRLADDLGSAQRRATALRRTILAAAFAGRLVPQDLADEPASVLLDRIRAERASVAPRKRTRKAKAS